MQLITVTILLLIHGNPTATVFMQLQIYLIIIMTLWNMASYSTQSVKNKAVTDGVEPSSDVGVRMAVV